MSGSDLVGGHARRNAVGYVALFIALTGTSYAATKIKGKEIAKNAITSKLIKDGQVKSGDVADDGLTGADIDEATLNVLLADGSVTTAKLTDGAVTIPRLAFDPATQAELDALAAAGTLNAAANPVDFSQLKNVPGDFADGVDNTAGPVTRSINLPLGSFLNITDSTGINFTSMGDNDPDYALVATAPVITYDADAGTEDTDFIATTITVPPDHASGGAFRIRASKLTSGAGAPVEALRCSYVANGIASGDATQSIVSGTSHLLTPVGAASLADNDTVAVKCNVIATTGSPGVYDDEVRIHSVAFEYTADR